MNDVPGIFAAITVVPLAMGVGAVRRRRRRRKLMRRPLPDEALSIIRRNIALYRILPDGYKPELHGHIQNLLAEKHFEGCGGLSLAEEMKVTIAAQACMLLLGRKSAYFPKCDSILVYPSAYVAGKKSRFGYVETEEASVRLGESWTQGVVVLAWDEVVRDSMNPAAGRNVVHHEFAHQLDQEDGAADGTPILASRGAYPEWVRVMSSEYKRLRERTVHHGHDVLDAYGATNEAEFFAVATEAFFNKAQALRYRHPELYGQLSAYYRLDPAAWQRTELV